jgi:hypothetical protein
MPTSEQLRKALEDSGLSLYRVAKDAGIPYSRVHGFAHGHGDDIRLSTVDRLADLLGLEFAMKEVKAMWKLEDETLTLAKQPDSAGGAFVHVCEQLAAAVRACILLKDLAKLKYATNDVAKAARNVRQTAVANLLDISPGDSPGDDRRKQALKQSLATELVGLLEELDNVHVADTAKHHDQGRAFHEAMKRMKTAAQRVLSVAESIYNEATME